MFAVLRVSQSFPAEGNWLSKKVLPKLLCLPIQRGALQGEKGALQESWVEAKEGRREKVGVGGGADLILCLSAHTYSGHKQELLDSDCQS